MYRQNIIKVNGLKEANIHLSVIPRNSSVLLLDINENVIYYLKKDSDGECCISLYGRVDK